MLYMLEMQIYAGQREKAVDAFEVRGPNRNPGVKYRGAWVAAQKDVVYALVEATDEPAVQNACLFWGEFGEWSYQPVVDIDKY